MSFQRDFNGLLNDLLMEYRNAFGDASNITEGHLLYIKAACTASMFWGLYQALDKAADQIFVTTADRAGKERHASEYGIAITPGMTDTELIDAVIEAKRGKLSGGSRYDYEAWAREATFGDERIVFARTIPLARGEGTFDVVVVGSKGVGVASPEICTLIHDTIQLRRPVGSGFSHCVRVCPVVPSMVVIQVAGSGDNWDRSATLEAIKVYVNNLLPREPIRRSQIAYLMHQNGATAAEVRRPLSDAAPPESTMEGVYAVWRTAAVAIEEL